LGKRKEGQRQRSKLVCYGGAGTGVLKGKQGKLEDFTPKTKKSTGGRSYNSIGGKRRIAASPPGRRSLKTSGIV